MQDLQIAKVPAHTRNLGSKLLGFILDLDVAAVTSLIADGGQITPQQQAALDQTEQVLVQVKKGRINNQALEWHDTVTLQSLRFSSGMPVLNGLRAIAGGHLTLLENDDPVKRALADMCLDCYPFTLFSERHDQFGFGRVDLPHLYGSEKMTRFHAAVRRDETIMKLYPEGDDSDLANSQSYYTSFGDGSSIQLALLPDCLIQSGIALMHARNESSVTSLQSAVWKMLDVLRASLLGEKPLLPVFDVFDLVGLPENFKVPIGNSCLTGIPKEFLKHIPRDARPIQNAEGDIFGGMLERYCEFNITLMSPEFEHEMESGWPIEISTSTNMEQRSTVALATSLAIENEKMAAARWRATIRIDPLRGVGQGWSSRNATLGDHHMLNSDECAKLTDHLSVINTSDIIAIDMAINRYLSATINRDDQQDSLVDAVIGLESLFGARAEISLSVASGVANLLGKDIPMRKDLFKLSKQIYNARSALVHGGSKQVAKLDIPAIRNSAVNLLKRCILELLENRSDLLPLSAEERVKDLVIG